MNARTCSDWRRSWLRVWALCAFIVIACSKGTVSKEADGDAGDRGGCKTTVCGQGIVSVHGNGAIDFRPWSGSQREWRVGAEIQDYLVGHQGVVYLLEEKGLFRFNLAEGLKSVAMVMQFRETQRYLEIIGEAGDGVWLLCPGVAVDRVGNGRVLEHFEDNQLPVPTAHQGNRPRVLGLSYTGMVGGVPYLAMVYSRQSYGYLVYNPEKKAWDAHFMRGEVALMPLVLEGKTLKELTVGGNAQSFPAPPGLTSPKDPNPNGLYARLGPNLFLTAMVGSPLVRQGIVVIDISRQAIVFHRAPQDLGRQGVYVREGTVWLWEPGWIDRPTVTSFALPPNLVTRFGN